MKIQYSVRINQLLQLSILCILIVVSLPHHLYAEDSKESCGGCKGRVSDSCEKNCINTRSEKDVPECLEQCLRKECKEPCACTNCRRDSVPGCKKACEKQDSKNEDSSCIGTCLRKGCTRHCGEPLSPEERPKATW